MDNKQKYLYVAVAVVGLSVATSTYAMGGQGMGSGMRNGAGSGQGMIDKNDNGIPDGMEDFDGDGVINREDDDFDKEYINMKDTDEDGIANRIDDDYEPVADGTNKLDNVGNRQLLENDSETQKKMNSAVQKQMPKKVQVKANEQAQEQNRVKNQNGSTEIMNQIKKMTQSRDQIQQRIADDVVQLQKQSKLKLFLMGSDQNLTDHAQKQIDQYEEKIEQLKKMSVSTVNLEDKKLIDEQITQMETMNAQMKRLIEKNSEGFSLFGGIKNLFN